MVLMLGEKNVQFQQHIAKEKNHGQQVIGKGTILLMHVISTLHPSALSHGKGILPLFHTITKCLYGLHDTSGVSYGVLWPSGLEHRIQTAVFLISRVSQS